MFFVFSTLGRYLAPIKTGYFLFVKKVSRPMFKSFQDQEDSDKIQVHNVKEFLRETTDGPNFARKQHINLTNETPGKFCHLNFS